jgi:hypothetical protein
MPEFSTTHQPETRGAGGQKKHKIARDALMVALQREVDIEGKPTKRIYQIADALVLKAAEGDVNAAREIFDRVDGKATQPIGGDDESPLLVQVIERIIRDPQAQD